MGWKGERLGGDSSQPKSEGEGRRKDGGSTALLWEDTVESGVESGRGLAWKKRKVDHLLIYVE